MVSALPNGPNLRVFENRLFAAWKGVHDDQGIYWSSFDGHSWAPQRRINGVGTSFGPSLALFEGRLFAAWKGVHDDQGIYWSSFNGNGWASQEKINGVGKSQGPSLAVFGGRLFAAWKGVHDDQGIYWSSAVPAAASAANLRSLQRWKLSMRARFRRSASLRPRRERSVDRVRTATMTTARQRPAGKSPQAQSVRPPATRPRGRSTRPTRRSAFVCKPGG